MQKSRTTTSVRWFFSGLQSSPMFMPRAWSPPESFPPPVRVYRAVPGKPSQQISFLYLQRQWMCEPPESSNLPQLDSHAPRYGALRPIVASPATWRPRHAKRY